MTDRNRTGAFPRRSATLVLAAAFWTVWFWNRAQEPGLERRTRRRLASRSFPIGERS